MKRPEARTDKITARRVETAAPKQPVVVEIPEYYLLPVTPRTLEFAGHWPPSADGDTGDCFHFRTRTDQRRRGWGGERRADAPAAIQSCRLSTPTL